MDHIGKHKRIKNRGIIERYIQEHIRCEACGKTAHGDPHHIRSVASGGDDKEENLLRLCWMCHYGTVHGGPGIATLVQKHPHLYGKVIKGNPALAAALLKHGFKEE